MVTAAGVAGFPDVSTATAFTTYAPAGSAPVTHQVLPLQLAPAQGRLANALPAPHSSIRDSATLSVPVAAIWMLLPVHVPPVGDEIATVGGVVSPPVFVGFATVTPSEALAVRPPPSVTLSVSVWSPFDRPVVGHA